MFKIRVSPSWSRFVGVVNYLSRRTEREKPEKMLIRISRSRDKKKHSRRDNKFILPSNKQRHPLSKGEKRSRSWVETNRRSSSRRRRNMADNKSHTEISDATHWCLWSVSYIYATKPFFLFYPALAAAAAAAATIHRCNPIIINLISNFPPFFMEKGLGGGKNCREREAIKQCFPYCF